MSWLNNITDSMDMNLNKPQEIGKDREVWYAAVPGIAKSRTHLSSWTELNWTEGSTSAMEQLKNTIILRFPDT